MVGTGTIVNVLAIIAGGSLGLLVKGGLKPQYQDSIIKSLGLATMFIALPHPSGNVFGGRRKFDFTGDTGYFGDDPCSGSGHPGRRDAGF